MKSSVMRFPPLTEMTTTALGILSGKHNATFYTAISHYMTQEK